MIVDFDEFELSTDGPELRRAGVPVPAERLVLNLLVVLVRNAGQLVTKQQLAQLVWEGRVVSDNALSVAVVRLRKTLGERRGRRQFIKNVHGQGYRFVRPIMLRDSSTVAAASHRAIGTPKTFVGRERVLSELLAALNEARRGQGCLFVLTGEPGIGKTRTVEMLEQAAAATGVQVAWGRCHEAGDTPPLWPFAELVRGVIQAGVDLSQPRLAPFVSELAKMLPELTAHPTAAAGPRRSGKHRMFDAITRVLAEVGDKPCLLVLEDIHRADSASLELLRYWVDELPRTRIMLVVTLRMPAVGQLLRAPLADITCHRNCQRVGLDRLTRDEVATYLEVTLSHTGAADAQRVFDKSQGNPFLMCEIARQLLPGEAGSVGEFELPIAARDFLRRRLAAFDDAELQILRCAALIGRRFELPLLRVVAQRSAPELVRCLDRAAACGVLQPFEPASSRFMFDHELMREVIYEAMPRSMCRQLHLRVVGALLEQRQAGESITQGELAFHAYAALPDGELCDSARYCMEAAKECGALYAYAEAARHLLHARQTLELVEDASPRLRLELLVAEALCRRISSDPDAEAAAREAVKLASTQRAGASLVRAALLLDLNPGFPALRGGREALERALELLPAEDCSSRCVAMARLATKAPVAFDAGRSRELLERALQVAPEARSDLDELALRLAELFLYNAPSDEPRAAEAFEALSSFSRANPSTLSVTPLLLELHRAIRASQAGDARGASEGLAGARAVARRIGSREWLWHVERFEVIARMNRAAEGAALELRALHGRARTDAVIGSDLFVAYDRAVLLGVSRGPRDPAFALDADDPPNIWSMKVRGLAAYGSLAEAESALARVTPAALANLPCDRDYVGTLGALARVSLLLDAREYMEALLPLLAPYAGRFALHVSFHCEGAVSDLLAELSRALGQSGRPPARTQRRR